MLRQPQEARPFDLLRPQDRYYEYEFERYWHFYQVFGRLGYNPATPPEVWRKEFARRFGWAAAPFVERALHRASWILPRINASIFPYGKFPTTRGWAEKQRWEDLPAYARCEPSDLEQFMSFREAVAAEMGESESGKVTPGANARWFEDTAAAVLQAADEARKRAAADNRELRSTRVDLHILAGLARYHARRIPAALHYVRYERTHNPAELDAAIAGERQAIAAWREIVEVAGDVYPANLAFGLESAGLTGHWRDELALLEKGLAALESARAALGVGKPLPAAAVRRDRQPPAVEHRRATRLPAGQPLRLTAKVTDPSGVKWVRVRFRAVNQTRDFESLPLALRGGEYAAEIPAAKIDPQYDLMYFLETMDMAGNGRIWPALEQETPYVVVSLER